MNGAGVYCEAQLPLSWEALDAPGAALLEDWNHTLVVLLRALAMMEAALPETEAETAANRNRQLERLEAKIDLGLNLLGHLLLRDQPAPPAVAVTLRGDGIRWRAANPPPAESRVLLRLHLSPRVPLPLPLPARIVAVSPADSGNTVEAEFFGLDAEAADWLERTVFRCHRRAISALHGHETSRPQEG